MPDPTDHEAAHAALTDPDRSVAAREWALIGHLVEEHDLDRFGDLPSDPQARERLHESLHPDPAPFLAILEAAEAQMATLDPSDHPDIAAVVVASLFNGLVDDDRPAVRLTAVTTATTMLGHALGRLAELDESSYAAALRQAVDAVADRLPDGLADVISGDEAARQ